MVNVKMEIDVLARCGGSVAGDSTSIFLSACLSFPTLNSLRVFSRAFTSSAFAVTFAFAVIGSVPSFLLFFTSVSSFSL